MDKKHILLIEDNVSDRDFFTDALEESKLSFLCSIARNTEQAVRILRSVVPDIIFLDMHISKTSGIELLKKIKRIAGIEKTQVVMYSNYHDDIYDGYTDLNYLHLPDSIKTMASILQNLLKAE